MIRKFDFYKKSIAILVFLGALVFSAQVQAVDAAYSRNGIFAGFGFGGGAGIITGKNTVGDVGLNMELGVGAGQKITASFRLDTRLELNTPGTMALLVPGPRLSIFLTNNAYLYGNVGLAMAFGGIMDGFAPGFSVGAGLGLEHFVSTNWAAYISVGADYFMLKNDKVDDPVNLLVFGLWLGMRYY